MEKIKGKNALSLMALPFEKYSRHENEWHWNEARSKYAPFPSD